MHCVASSRSRCVTRILQYLHTVCISIVSRAPTHASEKGRDVKDVKRRRISVSLAVKADVVKRRNGDRAVNVGRHLCFPPKIIIFSIVVLFSGVKIGL